MIDTVEALRALYPAPGERARRKQLAALDRHCAAYIERSPFLVLSTHGADGLADASPRGGEPGFVQVLASDRLLVPDSPGNNRLDSLENILRTGRIGLLFLIPGVDETLRVNGHAGLSDDPALRARCRDTRRVPKLVIDVRVHEAYLHCAKALMRSRLWDPSRHLTRSALPTMGEMISEQAGLEVSPETQEQMVVRYQADL